MSHGLNSSAQPLLARSAPPVDALVAHAAVAVASSSAVAAASSAAPMLSAAPVPAYIPVVSVVPTMGEAEPSSVTAVQPGWREKKFEKDSDYFVLFTNLPKPNQMEVLNEFNQRTQIVVGRGEAKRNAVGVFDNQLIEQIPRQILKGLGIGAHAFSIGSERPGEAWNPSEQIDVEFNRFILAEQRYSYFAFPMRQGTHAAAVVIDHSDKAIYCLDPLKRQKTVEGVAERMETVRRRSRNLNAYRVVPAHPDLPPMQKAGDWDRCGEHVVTAIISIILWLEKIIYKNNDLIQALNIESSEGVNELTAEQTANRLGGYILADRAAYGLLEQHLAEINTRVGVTQTSNVKRAEEKDVVPFSVDDIRNADKAVMNRERSMKEMTFRTAQARKENKEKATEDVFIELPSTDYNSRYGMEKVKSYQLPDELPNRRSQVFFDAKTVAVRVTTEHSEQLPEWHAFKLSNLSPPWNNYTIAGVAWWSARQVIALLAESPQFLTRRAEEKIQFLLCEIDQRNKRNSRATILLENPSTIGGYKSPQTYEPIVGLANQCLAVKVYGDVYPNSDKFKHARIWQYKDSQLQPTTVFLHTPKYMAALPQGFLLLVSLEKEKIRICDPVTGTTVEELSGSTPVVVLDDGSIVAKVPDSRPRYDAARTCSVVSYKVFQPGFYIAYVEQFKQMLSALITVIAANDVNILASLILEYGGHETCVKAAVAQYEKYGDREWESDEEEITDDVVDVCKVIDIPTLSGVAASSEPRHRVAPPALSATTTNVDSKHASNFFHIKQDFYRTYRAVTTLTAFPTDAQQYHDFVSNLDALLEQDLKQDPSRHVKAIELSGTVVSHTSYIDLNVFLRNLLWRHPRIESLYLCNMQLNCFSADQLSDVFSGLPIRELYLGGNDFSHFSREELYRIFSSLPRDTLLMLNNTGLTSYFPLADSHQYRDVLTLLQPPAAATPPAAPVTRVTPYAELLGKVISEKDSLQLPQMRSFMLRTIGIWGLQSSISSYFARPSISNFFRIKQDCYNTHRAVTTLTVFPTDVFQYHTFVSNLDSLLEQNLKQHSEQNSPLVAAVELSGAVVSNACHKQLKTFLQHVLSRYPHVWLLYLCNMQLNSFSADQLHEVFTDLRVCNLYLGGNDFSHFSREELYRIFSPLPRDNLLGLNSTGLTPYFKHADSSPCKVSDILTRLQPPATTQVAAHINTATVTRAPDAAPISPPVVAPPRM
jgi:hypothetical protein